VLAAYRLDVAAHRLAYPGSSIKPFTLMALLQAGKIDANTTLICRRNVVVARHTLNCSHPVTGQALDPAAALASSCNSYFTSVATRLSPAQLQENFVKDGFAAPTGMISGESSGTVALANSPEEVQLQSIGERGVKVTPLEMLYGFRHLALLQRGHDQTLAPVFEGLEQSVDYGMGREAQPASAMKIAGKTGTARSEEGPWTHAWFAGYAPARDPEIVLVVFLEKGRGGFDAAAIARQIFAAFAAGHDSRSAGVE
jgi:cell division protein FtsI/penicillin-binding protein 2